MALRLGTEMTTVPASRNPGRKREWFVRSGVGLYVAWHAPLDILLDVHGTVECLDLWQELRHLIAS